MALAPLLCSYREVDLSNLPAIESRLARCDLERRILEKDLSYLPRVKSMYARKKGINVQFISITFYLSIDENIV